MYINPSGQTMGTQCRVIDFHDYLNVCTKSVKNSGSPMKRLMDRGKVAGTEQKWPIFMISLYR